MRVLVCMFVTEILIVHSYLAPHRATGVDSIVLQAFAIHHGLQRTTEPNAIDPVEDGTSSIGCARYSEHNQDCRRVLLTDGETRHTCSHTLLVHAESLLSFGVESDLSDYSGTIATKTGVGSITKRIGTSSGNVHSVLFTRPFQIFRFSRRDKGSGNSVIEAKHGISRRRCFSQRVR